MGGGRGGGGAGAVRNSHIKSTGPVKGKKLVLVPRRASRAGPERVHRSRAGAFAGPFRVLSGKICDRRYLMANCTSGRYSN